MTGEPAKPTAERRWSFKLAGAAMAGVALLSLATGRCTHVTQPPASAGKGALAEDLPDQPEEWRGRLDYAALDARIRQMMADPTMQGLAVAVVENGRLSFVQGYGLASVDRGEPVGPHTTFRWASVSKTVSGTLVAKLDAEGKLSLGDPIASFGASLRLPGGAERTLRLDQLLSQQTGLPRNAFDGRLEDGQDPKALRRDLAGVSPMCPPGACHSYQNVAFDVVSEIVASAAKEPFDAAAEHELFEPLGMTNTTMGVAGLQGSGRWARPHRGQRELSVLDAYYRTPAAAGVNSDIVDLAKWMRAQMGLAPQVVSPQVLAQVQRPRVGTGRPYGNTPFGRALERPAYGLGVRSFTYRGHRLIGHSGAVAGYRATMMFDPASDTGVVMMWNSEASLPYKLQAEFLDLAYGHPFNDWLQLKAGDGRRGVD